MLTALSKEALLVKALSMADKECFHCGQPVPDGVNYTVEIEAKPRDMCCTGCEAVAKAIVANNLVDFYKHRTDKSNTPDNLVPAELRDLHIFDDDNLQKTFVRSEEGGAVREASLILEGIVCAACVWLNEKHVLSLTGVIDFRINYSTHRASLKWDNHQIQLSDVLKAITNIGYHAHPFDSNRLETIQKKEKSKALRRIAIAGIGMMQVMMLAIALYIGESSGMSDSMRNFLRWASLIITTPVLLFASRIFFSSAWRDIKQRQVGMDVPVAIAMGGAFSASVWATITQVGEVYFDSVTMFTFFLLTGRYLEMAARHKAGQVAEALVRLVPAMATRVKEGKQETVAVSELELGDSLLIKPGEAVPADGSVIEGVSSINESLLTGESVPLLKKVGSNLIGGTVNIESPLVMSVEKLGDSTILSGIIRLLERAQSEKPNLARLVDKVAVWFVSILLLIATIVFTTWSYLSPSDAFWITLSVLVVTCPCALSLATPVALTAATGALTEKGVLTTRGHALETLAKITHIVFDKTGTLTHGRLKVSEIQLLGSENKSQVESLAAGIEANSEHPIAQAITALSEKPEFFLKLISESGKGVEGIYKNQRYRLGTHDYVASLVGNSEQYSSQHCTTTQIFLGREGEWLASFTLVDEIRKEAREVIQKLKEQGLTVSLLSGDGQFAVDNVAQNLSITNAIGGLLPENKLQHLQSLQAQGDIVAMVGDGVNDAPVLASANVSLAMGSGSQLAQASADMVLLSENLEQLPTAVEISRRMQSIIKQNFSWAIGYNLVALPLAAMGLVLPWMAAIGMSMSSLLVVLNALRLKN